MFSPRAAVLGSLVPFTLLALAGSPAAQTQPNIVWHKDSVPAGSSNAFPWGSEGVRYQVIVPNSQFPARLLAIRDVFVTVDASASYLDTEITYGDIEIRMGLTRQLVPADSWTANNPNPTTVYRGPLRVAFKNGQWTAIGLPRPYPFVPLSAADNLCFEVIVWRVLDRGAGATSRTLSSFYFPLAGVNIERAFLYQWVQNGGHANTVSPNSSISDGGKIGLLFDDGDVVVLGEKGCPGSVHPRLSIGVPPNTWPKQGTPLVIELSGATPSTIAFLCLGSNDRRWGALTLPVDLGRLGAPGCLLWTDVITTLGTAVAANGTASIQVGMPQFSAGRRFTGTWVDMDTAANPLGAVTSDYAKFLIGF